MINDEVVECIRAFLFSRADPDSLEKSDRRAILTEDQITRGINRNRDDKVGRSRVREALARMECAGLGLLSREPQQPFTVHAPNAHEVREIVRLRELLECDSLKRIANSERRKARAKITLSSIQERMEKCEKKSKGKVVADDRSIAIAEEFWSLDTEFHANICIEAGNRFASIVIRLLRDRFRLFGASRNDIVSRMELVLEQHAKILKSITAKNPNPESIEKALKEHLDGAKSFLADEGDE